MANSRLNELADWLAPYAIWFVDYLDYLGLKPRVTSVFRSRAKQEVLYERYLRGVATYPVAPPGESTHEHRRAFDVVTHDNELAGRIWKQMGGRWWGTDPVHFEA